MVFYSFQILRKLLLAYSFDFSKVMRDISFCDFPTIVESSRSSGKNSSRFTSPIMVVSRKSFFLWVAIKEIFYDFFEKASPNPAHTSLAKMEEAGKIQTVITQNIDHLHQNAGSKSVIEYHGTSHRLICKTCGQVYQFNKQMLSELPPTCAHCKGILKPDFVFFGEPIPTIAQELAESETNLADVWIIVGTSGEVYPACYLPRMAKQNGKTIIEINTTPSLFTTEITDIFIEGEAGNILFEIANKMGLS